MREENQNPLPDDGSPPGHLEKVLGRKPADQGEGDGDSQVAQRPDNVPEKFWDAEKGEINTEALLKAQADGEAALRAAQQGDQKPDEKPEGDSEEPEGGDDNQSAALKKANELREGATKEFNETGDVSNETREAIVATGLYTRAEVDTYIAGQKAIIKELTDAAYGPFENGKEGYTEAAQWAAKNMTQAETDALDLQILSSDPKVVAQGAKALAAAYEKARGSEGRTIRGEGNGQGERGDTYGSRGEMMRDMASPRYRTDESFRREVAEKLRRSNL